MYQRGKGAISSQYIIIIIIIIIITNIRRCAEDEAPFNPSL